MNLQFPGENEMVADVQERLAGHFDYARRLLRYWIEDDLNTGFRASKLSPIVLRVLLSMNVKACRQFRSVIELCERGEAADGSVIARAMFETALVVGFLLKPRFTPSKYDKKGKVAYKIGVPGETLTRERRALLYVAHHLFQPERFATRHAVRPGMIRCAKGAARHAAMDKTAEECKREIGAEWTKILTSHPCTYSGLNISDLARSLGKPFPKWYDFVYGSQSEHVHAADLTHHAQVNEQGAMVPDWHSSTQHVCRTLQAGIALFYLVIGIMNNYVKFGVVTNTALDAFHREYKLLIEAEKP